MIIHLSGVDFSRDFVENFAPDAVLQNKFIQEKIHSADIFGKPTLLACFHKSKTFVKPVSGGAAGKRVQPHGFFVFVSAKLNDKPHCCFSDTLLLQLRVNAKNMHNRSLVIGNPIFPVNAVIIIALARRNGSRRRDRAVHFAEIHRALFNVPKYLHKTLKKYEKGVYDREFVRSEALRVFCLMREILLKAGELSGLGEDIFLLYIDEVKSLLREGVLPIKMLNERRENYRRQMSAPHYPKLIYGRFTEEECKKSGSMDYYRYGENRCDDAGDVLEGIARVISDISEADKLQKGEILVVQAANIGWVKISPKAAAIVTEIG